jgi:hypothetical protein
MWTWLACCALRQAARTSKARLSSEPDWFPVSVASTVRVAMERFGKWMPTRFVNAFDRLVMEVDGFRHDDPPCYHVPMEVLDLRSARHEGAAPCGAARRAASERHLHNGALAVALASAPLTRKR